MEMGYKTFLPALLDSGDGGVHIQVTHGEARPAGNYLADDLSNSVQITLAHFSAAGSASATSAVAVARRASARNSKLGTWLLASAVIAVTTVYTICSPKWVPSCVAQTAEISKQLSVDIKRRPSTPLAGTAVTDTAEAGAGTVAGAQSIDGTPSGRNSASAVERKGKTGNHTARSHAGDSGAGGKMPKTAEARTSKLEIGFMIPPPPPAPCVLPPGFGDLSMQQAQAQASPNTHDQSAARENTPQQPTAASGRTEASQSAALDVADEELKAALSSSLRPVSEWRR